MKKLWQSDGKRYAVSLQQKSDPCAYKDFFDSDKLNEAQSQAINAAKREQRKTLVFDRQNGIICFRCDGNGEEVQSPKRDKRK